MTCSSPSKMVWRKSGRARSGKKASYAAILSRSESAGAGATGCVPTITTAITADGVLASVSRSGIRGAMNTERFQPSLSNAVTSIIPARSLQARRMLASSRHRAAASLFSIMTATAGKTGAAHSLPTSLTKQSSPSMKQASSSAGMTRETGASFPWTTAKSSFPSLTMRSSTWEARSFPISRTGNTGSLIRMGKSFPLPSTAKRALLPAA